MLRTRIQKGEYWKETLPGLRSSWKRFKRISFLLKDQGLLSRTSIISPSLTKTARKRLLPTSLIVTPCRPCQSFWMVDLKAFLLKSLVDWSLNKILNWAWSLERAISWEHIAKTPFSSSERWNFLHSFSIAASIIQNLCRSNKIIYVKNITTTWKKRYVNKKDRKKSFTTINEAKRKRFKSYVKNVSFIECGVHVWIPLNVASMFCIFKLFFFPYVWTVISHDFIVQGTKNIVHALFTDPTILFTYLKIILLQCFQFSISAIISSIQNGLKESRREKIFFFFFFTKSKLVHKNMVTQVKGKIVMSLLYFLYLSQNLRGDSHFFKTLISYLRGLGCIGKYPKPYPAQFTS